MFFNFMRLEKFSEFLIYVKDKFGIIFQFNDESYIADFYEKIVNKDFVNKEDLFQKLKHPIIINADLIDLNETKSVYLSKNITSKEKSSIWNYNENKFNIIKNDLIDKDIKLNGQLGEQYLSKQSFIAPKKVFEDIKSQLGRTDYQEELYFSSANFLDIHGSELSDLLKLNQLTVMNCMTYFAKYSKKMDDHMIICHELIQKNKNQSIDFLIASEKYKLYGYDVYELTNLGLNILIS